MELPIQIIIVLTVIIVASAIVINISNDLLFRSQDVVLEKLDFSFDNQLLELNSINSRGVVEIAEKCIDFKKTSTSEELCIIIRLNQDGPDFNSIKSNWVSNGHIEGYLIHDGCNTGTKNIAISYMGSDIIKLKCN
jgi:hypothetical protein